MQNILLSIFFISTSFVAVGQVKNKIANSASPVVGSFKEINLGHPLLKSLGNLNNYLLYNTEPLHSNLNELAAVSAYDPINTSGADYGTAQYMWGLNTQNRSRIRQNGEISHIQLYIHQLPARLQSFWFFVWRKNGPEYDLIGQENIFSKLQSGVINFIKLAVHIPAQEGDFIGWGYEASSSGAAFLKSVPGIFGVKIQTTSIKPSDAYEWSAVPWMDSYLPIVCLMKAPDAIFIGNSIVSGFNNHIAYASPFNSQDNPSVTIPFKVAALKNWTYQNMGIGGETSNEVVARFEKDVCKLNPCYAVIECGVNDIAAGGTAESFLNNYKVMFELCRRNNIKPVVIRILPWTRGTNEQMQMRDNWNEQLTTLAITYNAVVVNADTVLGQFRAGGASGNLWNLKPEFTDDGIHLTITGNTAVSNYIVEVLQSKKIEPSVSTQPVPLTVCSGVTASFFVSATGEALTYQWQYRNDTGSVWKNVTGAVKNRIELVNISPAQNNNRYRCIVNGFCRNSDTSNAVLLSVTPRPAVTLTAAPYAKLFPGLQTTVTATVVPSGGSIVWQRNGVTIPNTTNTVTVNVDNLGAYKATVTGVGGCVGESVVLNILDSATSKIFFYPNPNQGQFQVRYNNPQSSSTQNYIRVFDTRGKKVYEQLYSVSAPYTQMLVDLRARGSGIYLVELSDKSGKRLATGKVYIKW